MGCTGPLKSKVSLHVSWLCKISSAQYAGRNTAPLWLYVAIFLHT